MKRTFAIATLCILVIATVGSTAAAAAMPEDTPQVGKSSIYQYDVIFDKQVVGKIVINARNPDAPMYVFNGNWIFLGETCYLQYHIEGFLGAVPIGAGDTDLDGHVTIKGTLDSEQWFIVKELPSYGYPGEFEIALYPC